MKNYEDKFMELVTDGEFSVDDNGNIWRLKIRSSGGPCAKCGNIYTDEKPRRAEHMGWRGYPIVKCIINGKHVSVKVHRIIYRHFYGEIPAGKMVNHKNGVKADNHPSNLEIVTHKENMEHALRSGVHYSNALKPEDVVEIRRRAKIGSKIKDIAADYQIDVRRVSDVVNGKSYKQIHTEAN